MQGVSQIKRAPVLVATLLTVVTLPTSQATYGQAKSVPASAFGPSLQVGDVDDVGDVDLIVSPTGAVAAFVPTRRWPGHEGHLWMAYRVSADAGRTWTRPVPTTPHLMAIHPNLIVLDNGVVACVYGRPGFHAVFSTDNGHTWQDRISFSHLPEPRITGQVHANKTGPNSLMVIGGVSAGGTQVFPVTVERTRVPSPLGELAGRVLDATGRPIAGASVQRGPNRYAADDWLEHETELDTWKAAPAIIGNPELAFRSIQKPDDETTVQTDAAGRFRMAGVPLGEFVLAVEARGSAPQQRHVTVRPQPQQLEFSLTPGKRIRGRVVDSQGRPISGACVVLNHWHCHTDRNGYFHWSAKAPLPKQVTVKVHKRYNDMYTTFKQQVPISELERRPITLQDR